MKITYNRSLPIVVLGMTPYYRAGPEKWFDNYTIVSYLSWDRPVDSIPTVYSLRALNPDIRLKPENTQSMVRSSEFAQIVKDNELKDSYFISYRPVDIGFGKVSDTDSKKYTRTYENKAWFRKTYAKKLRMPKFKMFKLRDIVDSEEDMYKHLCEELGDRLVIQHERLTGGRGTLFASDIESFERAITRLKENKKVKDFHKIIISRALNNPKEVSVQACVTRHGTFIGPVQSQIVRHPLLVNVGSSTADQFCGGIISNDLVSAAHRAEITDAVGVVASDLEPDGYTGIFGVDFLIDNSGELFIIEVNARMTGMLPLLSRLQSQYPFMLLHILEKIGVDYTIQQDVDLCNPEEVENGAYVVIHDLKGVSRTTQNPLPTGQYLDEKTFVSSDLEIPVEGVSLHSYVTGGDQIEPDKRVGAVFKRGDIDITDVLGGIPRQFIETFHESLNTSQ